MKSISIQKDIKLNDTQKIDLNPRTNTEDKITDNTKMNSNNNAQFHRCASTRNGEEGEPNAYRCALCGNDYYGNPYPIGKFDFEGEGTCRRCYNEYVVPCDTNPERHTPIYSPFGVGMTDGDQRSLLVNERWNYKVKLICPTTDTRPYEKLINKYNKDLEAVATAEGFDVAPNVDLELSDLIGKKIGDLMDILGVRERLPKDIVLTEKNIKCFKKQLTELKQLRSLKRVAVFIKK